MGLLQLLVFFQKDSMHLRLTGQHDAHRIRTGDGRHGQRLQVREHRLLLTRDQDEEEKTFPAGIDVMICERELGSCSTDPSHGSDCKTCRRRSLLNNSS